MDHLYDLASHLDEFYSYVSSSSYEVTIMYLSLMNIGLAIPHLTTGCLDQAGKFAEL